MSILIKGMEVPENCIECPISTYDEEFELVCPFSGIVCLNIGRQDNCPLVEIKTPHGRLIDAGSLYDRLENTLTHFIKVKSYTESSQKYDFGYCDSWNDAKAVLTNAPTIIEAEGGGEDGN